MWGNAFYYDDSLNIKSADEYGIVIGTSHHEPLMRAHEEWKYYGKGRKWNYDSTEAGLKEFWKGGMERAWNEKIVSVGMRGDGDEPMSRETATALLERIVKDQRQIIEEVTRQPASKTPQLWALYKEVQDYYDKGMRVPDDITLLLCDDNWGNIRKLPKLTDPPRKGGYGIYYHFDYVGGPRNYKWLNTNPIPRVWEQMHLAWEYNARQIWIVNVGDIKPMEFPITFFLDYASVKSFFMLMPALLTRISIWLNSIRIFSIKPGIEARLLRSQVLKKQSLPNCCVAVFSFSSSRPMIIVVILFWIKVFAIANPKPEPPPVITAIFFADLLML